MSNDFTACNEILDRVIRSRHTVRQFTDEIPTREMISEVIEAGRLSPYAGLPNKGTTDFRRFFVISKSSDKIDQLKALTIEAVQAKLTALEGEDNPKMQRMLNGMRMVVKNGPPIGNAPWLVIIAERRGFPAREDQALAFCLANMWLKATALGLGIQLVSAISDLKDSPEMSEMLGLATEEFTFDACSIGYPASAIMETLRDEPHLSITWFE